MAGTASQPVLLSMIGMSARFAPHPDIRSRGSMYCAKGMAALKDNLEHVCVETIQACILVGNNCFGDGDADAESLYFVLAVRMAEILKLGQCSDADDGVTRETKRRIFWTCFIIDTWASGGSALSRQFGWQPVQPRVPMDEYVFAMMRPGDPDIPDSEWRVGLWGVMVRLVEIYTEIQQLHKGLAATVEWDEVAMDESVAHLEAKLDTFDQTLDTGLKFSLEHLAAFVSRGLGSVFIAFHLGYHHYYTLLFYQYLDQRRPSTRNGKKYADRCKAHAGIICDVLRASREVPGAEALYNIVGHVAIVSSSVLLHTYLFGEPHELEDSKLRLESNLESLVQLRSYWPSVERMINRLVVFQKNCIRSLGKNTHRFDKWMVKFLIAHALALEDKVEDEPWLDPDLFSVSGDGHTGDAHFERSRITHSMMMDIQNPDSWEMQQTVRYGG
ncbi:hypothetical protein F5X68DRAFT_219817 [Plectosphaerella plurivora]|uniref:Xylanolytic transcriptional activator regulatory domain-containing protein n=1 Tax=Plectosphaerella plurivora TaxID=936078 RepID=A0A9P8VKJ5_9PEZI|nr:hypothetical protein F5X68DRAFT_219817 [Plectosphaerella plurivora]